jgi:hypothetical protein
MRKADIVRRVKLLCRRLIAQISAVAAMVACTFLGYQLHAVTSRTDFVALAVNGFHDVSGAVVSFFDMDPIAAAVLFPALLVAMLMLGALYLWRQQPD